MKKNDQDPAFFNLKEKKFGGDRLHESWSKLSQEKELSLKEKLEKLLSLAREAKKTKETPPVSAMNIEASPSSPSAGFSIFENNFPLTFSYGRVKLADGLKIKGETLALLSHDNLFRSLDLSRSLILDLETTGLSGGVGVIPFLIGVAFYEENSLAIRQFFLHEPAAEEVMLAEFHRFLQDFSFSSVVSFNGKCFDLPILETRFTFYRLPYPFFDLPHLDFIFPARSLWRHKHESCRLFHLAQQVIEADRIEDIPSSEVPLRYFSYLRTGDFSWVEPVLEHNQQDLLSLLAIVIAAAELVSLQERKEEIDGRELFGVARLLESAGEMERSLELLARAVDVGVPEPLAVSAKRKLAWYWKKKQQWEKAVALWEELAPLGKLFCYRELAIYYEHRLKDYRRARELAAAGLSLAQGLSRTYEHDFLRRLERLAIKEQKSLDVLKR